jgi:hypothetical protein
MLLQTAYRFSQSSALIANPSPTTQESSALHESARKLHCSSFTMASSCQRQWPDLTPPTKAEANIAAAAIATDLPTKNHDKSDRKMKDTKQERWARHVQNMTFDEFLEADLSDDEDEDEEGEGDAESFA